jgi:exodeoxyribonuclease VII small subunit
VPKDASRPATDNQDISAQTTFEAALAELETIVESMESGELPLEESLTAYKRGVALVKAAHARLAAAEEQVRVLEDGVLKPLALDGEADE